MPACDEEIQVRRARPEDARAIARVQVATWREAYRDIMPADFLEALSVDARSERWAERIADDPAHAGLWVAHTSREIVGFVAAGRTRDSDVPSDTGEIYAVYLMAHCWGRGVGRRLLDHAETNLRIMGYATAVLWCLTDNARARRFYERQGWRADGATKSREFGGREIDEVRYSKR